MVEILNDIGIGIATIFVISLAIHVLLYTFGLWDKLSITIKLPKSKKYQNKVDPIYELRESNWGCDVYIYKWSLMYGFNETWILFAMLVIPYPIVLEKFGYYVEDNVYLCDKKDVANIDDDDLKTIYENKMEIINQERKIKKEKEDKIKNKFDTLNQIFNENYE